MFEICGIRDLFPLLTVRNGEEEILHLLCDRLQTLKHLCFPSNACEFDLSISIFSRHFSAINCMLLSWKRKVEDVVL